MMPQSRTDEYTGEGLETICDEENSTVSVETTHFSKYMIVDRYKWFEVWNTELNYDSDILGISDKTAYKTVLTVSCSDTMKDNDSITSYEFMDGPDSIVYRKTCKRIRIVDSFINKMNETDKVSMVSVNSIKANELIQISSVDFIGNPKIFDALKNSKKAKQYAEYLIFDEEVKRLWIMW